MSERRPPTSVFAPRWQRCCRRQRTFDDKEGQRRTTIEIDAEDVAVSLTYATAVVTKTWHPGIAPQNAPGPAAGPVPPQSGQASNPAAAEPHPF
jgi:single-strand DNA-binding protein